MDSHSDSLFPRIPRFGSIWRWTLRMNEWYFMPESALKGYTGPWTTWATWVKFAMNHAPGAGLIARPVDQQSTTLLLYHGCPQFDKLYTGPLWKNSVGYCLAIHYSHHPSETIQCSYATTCTQKALCHQEHQSNPNKRPNLVYILMVYYFLHSLIRLFTWPLQLNIN